MKRSIYRSVIVIAFEAVALLISQGCNIKWDDKVVVGKDDTSLPGSPLERGCVLKIELGERSFPPDYNILFHNPDDSSATFTRHAGASSHLEVGKCYEWKLGFRDPSIEGISKEGLKAASKEIASDTVHAIDR
jgi:hypothetical protein